MSKVYINDIEYRVDDGIIIKDKYTEELDTAMITISFVNKLNLSPFDKVRIEDDRYGIKYFLIDTWTDDIVSFEPLKYTYNISLISETIKLQKVVLPNVTITQPLGATKKTIADMLERYMIAYVVKQYPELELSLRIYQLKQECPEYEFSRPTAYEVFNTLLSKVNGVVKIENGIIDYIELDEYGQEIDTSKIYYENETQNIGEYANRLDVQVTNAISPKDNYSTPNGISMRAGEGEVVVNTDNMIIMLEKPIYDINEEVSSIYVYVPYIHSYEDEEGVTQNESKIAKLDISSYVVEKAIYDTYKVSSSSGKVEGNYKRNALYYVRGDKKIEGLSYNETNILGIDTNIALQNIIENEFEKSYPNDELDYVESQIRDFVFFSIIYKTSDSYRFVPEKENTYKSTLIDNQTEPQVDSIDFGKVEQDKLNRLGNRNKIITATYEEGERIPELSDYIDDYVLAEREIVYYDDYALFKGYLYKDYVRKNMFYGLNSRKRSTQYSMESVVRNDVAKYDVSFVLDSYSSDLLGRYILTPLALSGYLDSEIMDGTLIKGADYNEYPKYCVIDTFSSRTSSSLINKGNGEKIILTPSSYSCGKSNIIHFQFMDNISAGIRLTENVTGGQKQEYVKYVNDYGEFEVIEFGIYTNARYDLFDKVLNKDSISTYRELANNLPLATTEQRNKFLDFNHGIISGSKRIFKDNRETTAITINIDYKDTDNVIIGSAFSEYTGIYNNYNFAIGLALCYSTTDEYVKGDEYGLGTIDIDQNVRIDPTNGYNWLNNIYSDSRPLFDNLTLQNRANVDMSNWKSWGIVEKDTNRLILGVNKGNLSSIPQSIYIKVERKDY